MKTSAIVFFLLIFITVAQLVADEPASQKSRSPVSAATTGEIVKAIEPLKGFGSLESVLFNRRGRQIFAIWYCPFSGRDDCYLHAYYYDADKKQWSRFIDTLVTEAGGDLSAEMPTGETITFKTRRGKVLTESVAKLPRQESEKKADH